MYKIFKVKDNVFEEYMSSPLVEGDIGAYKIVLVTDNDLTGCSVRITAKRADGVYLDDIGTINGNNAEYMIKSSIYSVEGEVEIRFIISDKDGNSLTDKALIFNVLTNYRNGSMENASDDGKTVADLALAHMYSYLNPHRVTKAQIGLSKVLNEEQATKVQLEKVKANTVFMRPEVLKYGTETEIEIIAVNSKFFFWVDCGHDGIDTIISDGLSYAVQNTDGKTQGLVSGYLYILELDGTGVDDGKCIIHLKTVFNDMYSAFENSHAHSNKAVLDGISGVDTTPKSGSGKLVTSGGVYTAVNGKANATHTHSKLDVGLSNVDNTSDANKPISTAVQTALNEKQNTLTFDTSPKSGSTNPVTSGGVYTMGESRVRRKDLNVLDKPYIDFVIPLCIVDNTIAYGNNYFSGNIFLKRGNTVNGMIMDIDITCGKLQDSTNPLYSMVINRVLLDSVKVQPVKFTYNSKEYFGIYVKGATSNFHIGCAKGNASNWDIIDYIPVYDSRDKEVLNSEIYESITIAVTVAGNVLPKMFYGTPLVTESNDEGKRYKILHEGNMDSLLDGKIGSTTASAEEYETGKIWIDGKPIYRKDFVWKITGLTANETQYIYPHDYFGGFTKDEMYMVDGRVICQDTAYPVNNWYYDNGYMFDIEPFMTEAVVSGYYEYVKGDYSDFDGYTAVLEKKA